MKLSEEVFFIFIIFLIIMGICGSLCFSVYEHHKTQRFYIEKNYHQENVQGYLRWVKN